MSSYITAFSGGSIQVIFGPMFSGKTTELMRRVKRFTVAQYNCMVIKYAKDTRYSVDQAATHDRMTCAAISCARLSELDVKVIDEYDVLAVDEGQFFPDVVEFCESMANAGKIVLVAALDGTFERKEFNNILKLVPLAEEVVKLNAVCMVCHKEAAFSKRIGQEKEVEVIGGTDKYIAACRRCYFGKPAMANTPRKRKAATIYNPSTIRMRSASSASSSTLPATPEVDEPSTSDEEPSSPVISATEIPEQTTADVDVVVSAQA